MGADLAELNMSVPKIRDTPEGNPRCRLRTSLISERVTWQTPRVAQPRLCSPHKKGRGFNIMLQAIPFDAKIVIREITGDDKDTENERIKQAVRQSNDRRTAPIQNPAHETGSRPDNGTD
jgi:hypothetical protein